MARQISEDVSVTLKELVKQISGIKEDSDNLGHIEKQVITKVKKSDSMYFLNKREIDESISSMAEKFTFHGFVPQARSLQDFYKSYITEALPKPELTIRLNVVKFLLCLSERPTSNFLNNPEEYKTAELEEKEEIDWGEYLKEGIERWSPNFEDTSASSDSEEEIKRESLDESRDKLSQFPLMICQSDKSTTVDFRTTREELLATIQHTWYNKDRFFMPPPSDWEQANTGILWDKFLEEQVAGLIPIEKASVLSEYKVIREILWQLWIPHTSAVFELIDDKLKPKSNVTISSVRAFVFEHFLREFMPYIEVLDFFRQFSKSLDVTTEESIIGAPLTYRSYNQSLQNVIRPVYKKLVALEDMVREQETTYTLLNLAQDMQVIFEPVLVLKKIHDEIVIDTSKCVFVTAAATLISRLHYSLQFTANKLEQDLRITLLMESLYHYFTIIDSWLMKDDFSDYSMEFLIINKNNCESLTLVNEERESDSEVENWKFKFELRDDISDFCKENGILKIVQKSVLQLGRNIHFLRLLREFSMIKSCSETIHQEFIRKSLEKLCDFFGKNPQQYTVQKLEEEPEVEICEENYKYPVIWSDECNTSTDMDKLENLVDVSDGFLMLAFKDYLIKQPEKKADVEHQSLFEKVSEITTTMFPVKNFFEKILTDILEDRFTISGLMVKNILIERYLLEKQFQFLRHVFMFFDDMIFPFYRGLFKKTNTMPSNWGNDVWLTSHLQDVIADAYPEFYDKCSVQIKENWRQCTDSLEVCNLVHAEYQMQWPLDIIITGTQMALYKSVFQFVLKIKWALYTVNHLAFTDLEPKKINKKVVQTHKDTIMKLKYLKFAFINILNSIQHYVFSFVFTKCLRRFELDFEKANDLSSIINCHANFIHTVYAKVMDVKNCGNGSTYRNILNAVKILKLMWSNVEYATPERLGDYYKVYNQCYQTIDPIICPKYLFDY